MRIAAGPIALPRSYWACYVYRGVDEPAPTALALCLAPGLADIDFITEFLYDGFVLHRLSRCSTVRAPGVDRRLGVEAIGAVDGAHFG